MASIVDDTASPCSAKLSSPLPQFVGEKHEPNGGCGDGNTFPSSPSASSVAYKAPSGRSPGKPSVETQSRHSSAGPEHGGSDNASDASPISSGKKPAWKVPPNSAIEVGLVMDAISWPALTESARASPKSSSSDFVNSISDGSLIAPQGTLVSSPSSKKSSDTHNLNSSLNSPTSRDKTTTRRGPGAGGSSNNSISEAAIFGPIIPSPSTISIESSQKLNTKQQSIENPSRVHLNKISGNNDNDRDHKAGRSFPQPHAGNGRQQGYGGGRRGSSGKNNSYGNRRDGERGGYGWSHQNFGGDVHMQLPHQQRGVPPHLRHPSVAAAPFITAPPLRPFANHMGFPDFPSPIYFVAASSHPETLNGVPFASHPANVVPQMMLFPGSDPQRAMLLKQIDYYFSPENLCKDLFLRQNMDEQGWVPISVIANFNRVKQMTNSLQYLIDTVQLSCVVEAQGDKIRKRDDWMAWVLHPAEDFTSSVLPSSTANFDALEDQFDNVYLGWDAPDDNGFRRSVKNEVAFSRSASMNLSGDDDGQAGNYSNHVWSMRTLTRNDTM